MGSLACLAAGILTAASLTAGCAIQAPAPTPLPTAPSALLAPNESAAAPSASSKPLPACQGRDCPMASRALMLAYKGTSPPAAVSRRWPNSILGRCEVRLVKEKSGKAKTEPCSDVRITLQDATGQERAGWVRGGFDFEMEGLAQGPYSVYAVSEKYQTHVELQQVDPGAYIKIEVRVTVK